METTKHFYGIALSLLDGIGSRTAKTLLQHFEEPQEIFERKDVFKTKIKGFSKERIKMLNRSKALIEAEYQMKYIEKHDIRVLFYGDEDYPKRLMECPDAPIVLYAKGNFNSNPSKTISIVGTRRVTNYGEKLVKELIDNLKEHNVQIVSGLAYGVDIKAHRYALKNNLSTIGVLGHGLDRLYPNDHKNTALQMIENEGGILTEFLPGTNPDRENFPKRNRIVAGMTDATVVIESGRTGGSLITANLAFDYNRDVYAFPGNIDQIYSEGCNYLIAEQKAKPLLSGKDIIKQMNWKQSDNKPIQQQLFANFSKDEQQLLNLIQKEKKPLSIDSIAMKLKRNTSQISSFLLSLEIQGVIKPFPGSKFGLI